MKNGLKAEEKFIGSAHQMVCGPDMNWWRKETTLPLIRGNTTFQEMQLSRIVIKVRADI
jgi:hypothetical protein